MGPVYPALNARGRRINIASIYSARRIENQGQNTSRVWPLGAETAGQITFEMVTPAA